MLYFAYGSNMDPVQMRQRCPESAFVGIGVLPGHTLCFPRYSPLRQCGAASYRPDPQSELWGVIYRVTANDFARLDGNEGFDPDRPAPENSYNRIEIIVRFADAPTQVQTYLANPQDGVHVPSLAYLAHLRDGAQHHGLPATYQAILLSLSHQLPV